jgi:anti-anti-sigma factor
LLQQLSFREPMTMDTTESILHIQQQADVHVVTFLRDVHNPEVIDQIQNQLRKLIEQAPSPRIVINFEKLRYVGSNFLGMIMAMAMQATHKKGQVRVCNMSAEVRDLFALTRLDSIVPVLPSLDEALASFN